MKVAPLLVTGANGFIGSVLVRRLASQGHQVRAAVRAESTSVPHAAQCVSLGELSGETDWSAALVGVTTVFHCAARAHVLRESAADPMAEFRRVNAAATLGLAKQALAAGVKRLVFLSSIGVLGAETFERPFTAQDVPMPDSPYAVSKWEAEQGLNSLAGSSGLEVVIVRPPLVYGPGARGNIARMMRWLRRGVPLPFGAIDNRRSFVGVDNLVDFLIMSATHPAAANQVLLVSDGEDVSTPDLLRRIGDAAGTPARLFPVPASLLRLGARALGLRDMAQRLCGSLQVDMTSSCQLLGWVPPLSLDTGLRQTAEYFRREARI